MVIRSLPDGEVLKLKDVAVVELSAQTYNFDGQTDGHPGSSCMIFQTADSNANEVVAEINEYLTTIEKDLPKGEKSEERFRQIVALEQSVTYTEVLMKLGTSTYLEVLTAQQGLLSARLTQVADQFEQMQAVINLYQALGGGREE